MLDTSSVATAPHSSSPSNSLILTTSRLRHARHHTRSNSVESARVSRPNAIKERGRTNNRSFLDALPSAEVGVALDALRFLEPSMIHANSESDHTECARELVDAPDEERVSPPLHAIVGKCLEIWLPLRVCVTSHLAESQALSSQSSQCPCASRAPPSALQVKVFFPFVWSATLLRRMTQN